MIKELFQFAFMLSTLPNQETKLSNMLLPPGYKFGDGANPTGCPTSCQEAI